MRCALALCVALLVGCELDDGSATVSEDWKPTGPAAKVRLDVSVAYEASLAIENT